MAKSKENVKKPTVNKTLLGLFAAQHPIERQTMTESLKSEGCRDDIIVWKERNEVVDGHNRFAICEEHGIPYGIKYRSFANEDAAIVFMLENQLGRRNIQSGDRSLLLGKLMLARKRQHGQKTGDPETAKKLAADAGVSERTVYRGEAYAKALDAHPKEKQEEIQNKVRTGELTQNEVIKTAPKAILCTRCRTTIAQPDCPDCKSIRAGGKERPYIQPTKRRQPEPDRDACRDARDTLKNLRKKVIALLTGKAGTTLQKLARAHDAAFRFVEALKDGKTVRVPTWPAVDKLIDLMNEVWQAKYE